jgi:hypothetical protein
MKSAENVFVVPNYRLRDVGATIEAYDEHFWSNGHSVKMMVFDDSSLANHENISAVWNTPKPFSRMFPELWMMFRPHWRYGRR